ncbi:tail fiber protein [Paenibacillus aurantius]|uniref:Tail fiber protein n=1 Tax=Paenibacillus aurantius TaxID=2918900 RepID=A0AA96LG21_9BACL|nr:tail fiber protein [Paenibacillus aurantius]WNQ13161.1 tail fiber protein [Paenibacillus aurantius]
MDPFIGEIRIFAGNFAPKGWAFCNGQLIPLIQNTALFSLLGTMYGGDGKTTFALPNLSGASPMGAGQGQGLTNRIQGASGGTSMVTLLTTEMPVHNHVPVSGPGPGNAQIPEGVLWSATPGRRGIPAYGDASDLVSMHPAAIGAAGASQPHNNRQPYLGLNFIIALQGIFPSRP